MSFSNKTSYQIDFIIIAISIINSATVFIQLCVGLCKIRDKSRPVFIWYGTHHFTFKYGTIPYFKGWVATLLTTHIYVQTT